MEIGTNAEGIEFVLTKNDFLSAKQIVEEFTKKYPIYEEHDEKILHWGQNIWDKTRK